MPNFQGAVQKNTMSIGGQNWYALQTTTRMNYYLPPGHYSFGMGDRCARQLLHVGYKVAARTGKRYLKALNQNEIH
jgi:hypothetical protein